MISCGEPSGDLYAGALTRELLRTRSVRSRSPASAASGFAAPARRWWTTSRACRSPASWKWRACCRAPTRSIAGCWPTPRRRRPDVFVAIDFPDFNFRLAHADAQARRAGRLLHQPAVLGVAAGPDEDHAAHCRSRAGHLSVRRRDLPARRRSSRMGGPSAARRVGGRGAARDLSGTPRPRPQRSPSLRCSREAGSTRCARSCRAWWARPGSFTSACRARSSCSRARRTSRRALRRISTRAARSIAMIADATDDVLAAADVALVASGTVTVQAALHECPMVVVYRLSP